MTTSLIRIGYGCFLLPMELAIRELCIRATHDHCRLVDLSVVWSGVLEVCGPE